MSDKKESTSIQIVTAGGRCTLVRLDLTDLGKSVEDLKLGALLASGWTVVAHVPIEVMTQSGTSQELQLVLAPPPLTQPEEKPAPTTALPGWVAPASVVFLVLQTVLMAWVMTR